MTTEKKILDMYCEHAQRLAEEFAPRLLSAYKGAFFTKYDCPAYRQAKALDKSYRRALLDVGAVKARTAVELGWHFERTLRREARALCLEKFREQASGLEEAMARAWQQQQI